MANNPYELRTLWPLIPDCSYRQYFDHTRGHYVILFSQYSRVEVWYNMMDTYTISSPIPGDLRRADCLLGVVAILHEIIREHEERHDRAA